GSKDPPQPGRARPPRPSHRSCAPYLTGSAAGSTLGSLVGGTDDGGLDVGQHRVPDGQLAGQNFGVDAVALAQDQIARFGPGIGVRLHPDPAEALAILRL